VPRSGGVRGSPQSDRDGAISATDARGRAAAAAIRPHRAPTAARITASPMVFRLLKNETATPPRSRSGSSSDPIGRRKSSPTRTIHKPARSTWQVRGGAPENEPWSQAAPQANKQMAPCGGHLLVDVVCDHPRLPSVLSRGRSIGQHDHTFGCRRVDAGIGRLTSSFGEARQAGGHAGTRWCRVRWVPWSAIENSAAEVHGAGAERLPGPPANVRRADRAGARISQAPASNPATRPS